MPEAHGQDGVMHFKVDFCVKMCLFKIWSSPGIKSIKKVYFAKHALIFLKYIHIIIV